MSAMHRKQPLPEIPLPPGLTARVLDQLVYNLICDLPDASGLPEMEDELTELIEEHRRHDDPPARVVAVRLMLKGLDRVDAELDEMDRQQRPAVLS